MQRLRLGVGIIGILLPVALPLGNWIFVQLGHRTEILPASMSGAYYTSTRNIFVGSLCALGVFLIGYRYNRRDDFWSTLAGVFAIGVALFPTAPRGATEFQSTIGALHLIFAGVLLSALAMFCLWSFRDPAISAKRTVNRSYLITGVLILLFLALSVVAGVTRWGEDWTITPLYICESLSVWAFGAAWIGAAVEIGALQRTRTVLPRRASSAQPAAG
ncbi:DUF998 domain-containing protein [Kitasatospora atroaurantiaca]|uniref:DUF998 domain-containing protein n=1 Tax=Kitasatospora atroaurantiaca TaxID=285545 RepID=A0A561EJL3_9ACTN|nr:hypothetical protein FB465_0740 [Kitasatospora atroaurantiaca]